MHYTITDTIVEITCTLAEIAYMEAMDHAIYATPTPPGLGPSLRRSL